MAFIGINTTTGSKSVYEKGNPLYILALTIVATGGFCSVMIQLLSMVLKNHWSSFILPGLLILVILIMQYK